MKTTAWINDTQYTFLECLSSLDGPSMLLCADQAGKRVLCSESLWSTSPEHPAPAAPVHGKSSAQEKIDLFLQTFQGREGLHARRYYSVKTGKSGYTPVCKNEWAPGLCDKKAHRCPDCPNRAFLPLTVEVVKAHLMGRDEHCRDVAAIYPMLEDNRTWLLALDFDEEHWREDVTAFRAVCRELGLTPAVERSRSGNGAHIWFFFSAPVSAAEARRLGSGLLTRTMERRHEVSFTSYDRMFPAQDSVPKGGFGNLIALPFQGQAQKNGNTLFLDEAFEPYPDQWAYLSLLPKITPEEMTMHLHALCWEGELGTLAETEPAPVPWQKKRTRRSLAGQDFPIQVRLVNANLIYLEKKGFSEAALNALRRLAAFPNPEFRARQAMRLPVYQTPCIIDCGYEDGEFIGLPRGCRDNLLAMLEEHDVPTMFEEQRCQGRAIDVTFNGILRPEQELAARALIAEEIGVLSAATAFGKTVIGAWLIGQRKVNTLILVQSSTLLGQWKGALEQFLDIREEFPEQPKKRGRKKKLHLIGQLGGGKRTRSGIVDIAIMQSLFEGEGKSVWPLVEEYGMVIVDECHHVAAFTFERVMKQVRARYVYGLSATPVRKDGHHPIIFMQCGPVRYLVDAKSQAEKRSFSHFVLPRVTRTRLPEDAEIQALYAGIIENDRRNQMLLEDALKLVQAGRTPVLLTERKEHAALLAGWLEGRVKNVFLLVGSEGQKAKREKLAALQAVPPEEPLVVVATGKYIGEGFDAPRLDTLLLAMPISWKGTLAQYAGRLHRSYEGKEDVRIYDYVDVHVPKLERMYHKRLRGYRELGYQVKFGERDDCASRSYDGGNYAEPFALDIAEAVQSVVISSPYLHKGRVAQLLPVLEEAVRNGVRCEIRTASMEDSLLELLRGTGCAVEHVPNLRKRCAVLDAKIVWYGSVELLAFSKVDSDVLRFESREIAAELLGLNHGEQIFLSEYV